MKLKSVQYVLALLLTFMASTNAWALVTCTASSPAYSATYLPTDAGTNVSPSINFTVRCLRDTSGNASGNVTYTVTANNGNGPIVSGTVNRAKSGSSFLNYDLYKGPGCANEFQGANTFTFSQTLAQGAESTQTYSFIGCIPALQTIATPGPYLDNVSLTVTGSSTGTGGFASVNGAVTVTIATPMTCAITTLPAGTISLPYTAFQPSAARVTSLFRATCSGTLRYTMKITNSDNTALVTNAVAAGINYSLGVSLTIGGPPANPLTGTDGTGSPQDGYIIVTAPANQAGSCLGGCSQTNTHYLTLEW